MPGIMGRREKIENNEIEAAMFSGSKKYGVEALSKAVQRPGFGEERLEEARGPHQFLVEAMVATQVQNGMLGADVRMIPPQEEDRRDQDYVLQFGEPGRQSAHYLKVSMMTDPDRAAKGIQAREGQFLPFTRDKRKFPGMPRVFLGLDRQTVEKCADAWTTGGGSPAFQHHFLSQMKEQLELLKQQATGWDEEDEVERLLLKIDRGLEWHAKNKKEIIENPDDPTMKTLSEDRMTQRMSDAIAVRTKMSGSPRSRLIH